MRCSRYTSVLRWMKAAGPWHEDLFLQQVDAQGVQQGGAVGLVVFLQAAQHGWMKARRLALWAMVRTNTS